MKYKNECSEYYVKGDGKNLNLVLSHSKPFGNFAYQQESKSSVLLVCSFMLLSLVWKLSTCRGHCSQPQKPSSSLCAHDATPPIGEQPVLWALRLNDSHKLLHKKSSGLFFSKILRSFCQTFQLMCLNFKH